MKYNYGKIIVHLCKCAVLNTKPALMQNINYKDFFYYCKEQKLCNVAYSVLSTMNVLDKETVNMFSNIDMMSIQLDAQQEYYQELVSNALEDNGIDYVLLKGRNMARLYPYTYWRISSDIDMLILDNSKMDDVHRIMTGLGFNTDALSEDNNHDIYSIDNKIHFEMHRRLFSEESEWYQAGCNLKARLVLKENTKHCYVMCPEDFYAFMIAHMAKHVKYSGIGIRLILDVWVFLLRYSNSLNMALLKEILNDYGLNDFNHMVNMLINRWFYDDNTCNKVLDEFENFIFSGGWNGNKEIHSAQAVAVNIGNTKNKIFARIKQYFYVVFMPYSIMKTIYPILKKKTVLLPFYWIYRIFNALIFKRSNVRSTFNNIQDSNISEAQKMKEFNVKIGLK